MKAVIYARVSSTDDSQSNDRQIEDLKTWAKYLNLEVDKIFDEKISGYRKSLDERVEFNKMKEYIEENDIKHILISELSRLSRRFIDTVNYVEECTKNKIAIHIQKEGLSTLNKDGEEDPLAKMFLGILSNMAEQESKTISYRVRSGKNIAASKGLAFPARIYGYDKGPEGKPVINEEEAVLVRKMFEMLLEGHGVNGISTYLNKNYDTKRWTSASVHSIVRNSFFCGKRKYNGRTIPAPAIVSEETFNEAQKFIDSRKRYAARFEEYPNPFASFIKCECGATMHQIIVRKSNINVYRCPNKCGVKSINRPFLIREVKKVLEKYAALTKQDDIRGKLNQKIKVNNSTITSYEKEIRRLITLSDKNYERFLENIIDKEKYEKFENKFKTELAKLKKEIKVLRSTNKDIEESLKGQIMHYSDDLNTFKSQILKAIDYIEVGNNLIGVKIKGWFKVPITPYRGTQLYYYNKAVKEGREEEFESWDWDNLPETDFTEEIHNEEFTNVKRIKKIIRENGEKKYIYWGEETEEERKELEKRSERVRSKLKLISKELEKEVK